MSIREVITIDEEKCNGCGQCVPDCPEGALQIIDGKARLISDILCDGLGACIGSCPEDAIHIEKREAEEYDEFKVMANVVKQGKNVIAAHLKHLYDHEQTEYLGQAVEYLKENNMEIPVYKQKTSFAGCPGAATMEINHNHHNSSNQNYDKIDMPSELSQWPIQMHLISPHAPFFKNSDLLIAADCVAYSIGNFHSKFLKGKKLVIACPKLDENQNIYLEKIRALINGAKVNTITVMIMQVPCCMGLFGLVQQAALQSKRKIPIKKVITGIDGRILSEGWI